MTPTETPSAPVQNYNGHDNLSVMSVMNHYNRWIYDTMAPYLGKRLFEAGCGTGNLTAFFLRTPGLTHYVGVDLSPAYCSRLQREIVPLPGVTVDFHAANLQDPSLKFTSGVPFDTIVCSNVLEHIENDRDVLRSFYDMLTPGGKVVLQVPALQMLYGSIDVTDHHVRRYSRRELVGKVKEAGFTIKKASYFNLLGIPAWIWHGKIMRHQTHPQGDLAAWDRWVPWIRKLESLISLPIGLAVFVVGEKPHHG